jgi:hypothetical protein
MQLFKTNPGVLEAVPEPNKTLNLNHKLVSHLGVEVPCYIRRNTHPNETRDVLLDPIKKNVPTYMKIQQFILK